MAIQKGRKKAAVSSIPIQFKPKVDDFVAIDRMAQAEGTTRPVIVTRLVSERLKSRRLEKVGKDVTTQEVVDAQKKAMKEVLTPLVEQLERQGRQLERLEGRVAEEFAQAGTQRTFLVNCIRFIVFELLIVRLLMRDYIHTAYIKFVESVGRPVKDIEANFEIRLDNFKKLSNEKLDSLTTESVGDLHQLAESKDGFL